MGISTPISRRTIRRSLFWLIIAVVVILGASQILAFPTGPTESKRSPVIISEFVADNRSGALLDEDGDASDWIEITNRSDNHVNLQG